MTLFLWTNIFSQIMGISASKLGTYNAQAISKNHLEFEPSISMAWTRSKWDLNYNEIPMFQSNDSSSYETELGFRFTYGLFDNIEIGIFTPAHASCIGTGIKYNFISLDNLYLSAMAGVNFHTGNSTYNTKIDYSDKTTSINGGLILSYEFNNKLSIDINGQMHKHVRETLDKHLYDTFFSTDIGYFVTNGQQLVTSINYSKVVYEESTLNQELFMLNTGLTIETANNYLLVLSAPIDIFGKNCNKIRGFSIALTICFE